MKNIRYEGPRRPREEQLKRMRKMLEELTPRQREIFRAYYEEEKTVAAIAAERRVCRSTVYRTLRRAEARLQKFLSY